MGLAGLGRILLCFAVVIVLSLLMEVLVFRPLRGHSPAVMLVATFAVAFLLQNIALLWFGALGKIATSVASLNRPVDIGGVDIRKISIVAVVVAILALVLLNLLLRRTEIGLHMRAASMDSATARVLGVRADRVISVAVLISAVLAAIVAVMLTVQTPLVTPDFALDETIVVLVAAGRLRLLQDDLGHQHGVRVTRPPEGERSSLGVVPGQDPALDGSTAPSGQSVERACRGPGGRRGRSVGAGHAESIGGPRRRAPRRPGHLQIRVALGREPRHENSQTRSEEGWGDGPKLGPGPCSPARSRPVPDLALVLLRFASESGRGAGSGRAGGGVAPGRFGVGRRASGG